MTVGPFSSIAPRALIRAKHVTELQDAIEYLSGLFGQENPEVNLANELDGGSPDHRVALQTLIDENGPGYTYRIPRGMTVKLPLVVKEDAVQFRNKVKIVGDGPDSIIQVSGFEDNPADEYAAMGIIHTEQTTDVDDAGLFNLTVLGDGIGDAQNYTDYQAAAFRVVSYLKEINRLTFQNVTWKNINGFNYHSDGLDEKHTLIDRCRFINGGNGLNPNGPFTTVRNNYFTNIEGVEASGAGTQIIDNFMEEMLGLAISVGGYYSPATFPSQSVRGNKIFGVHGGASYGGSSGNGISLSQSSPDCYIGENYVERTYGPGLVTTHDPSTGPDDGHIVVGNHFVNCTQEGAPSRTAVINYANNVRYLGNRIYNRLTLPADVWPVTGYGCQRGFQAYSCDNLYFEGNDFDVSVTPSDSGSTYAAAFGSVTNIIFGINRFQSNIPGGNNPIEMLGGSSASAAGLNYKTLNTTGDAWTTMGYRHINVTTPGVSRNVLLHNPAGLAGAEIIITAINGATNTVVVLPDGKTIDGSGSNKTISSDYGMLHVVSDGTNWRIVNIRGTVT